MGGSPIWEELETMELLDIWRQSHLQSALRSNVRNKWIWEHVADQLWHRGFVRSGEQCKNKVHNLLCVYRNVCRGRLPRWRCRYFDLLHRVASARDVNDLEDPVDLTEKTGTPPKERVSEVSGAPPSPSERSRRGHAGSEEDRKRSESDGGRSSEGGRTSSEGERLSSEGGRAYSERERLASEGECNMSEGRHNMSEGGHNMSERDRNMSERGHNMSEKGRATSEESRLSPPPPPIRQRSRRALPALVPIGCRSVPEAAASLALCSADVRMLLSRLWAQRLQAGLLEGVTGAGGGKATRDGPHRDRPYPSSRPPLPLQLQRPAEVSAPRCSIAVTSASMAVAEARGVGLARGQESMVIARVPLLSFPRENNDDHRLEVSPPHKPSPPTERRVAVGPARTSCAAAGRSTEALRGPAARGMVLLPSGLAGRGIAAAGNGVIRIDID